MKKIILILQMMALALLIQAQGTNGTAPNGKEIVQKAYEQVLGKSSISDMSMTIVRPEWTRTIDMQNWSLGTDYYMTYITSPARDKGQVFMKRETEMWNWMPAISRMIKIPPSMMMQSWMGSDFTNNDLMKQNSLVKDYTHKVLGDEEVDGNKCWKIQLDPLPEAAVVWGQVIMWITKEDYISLKTEYKDESKETVKLEQCSDIKMMGGRKIATHLEMIPVQKKGHKTTMTINMQKFDVKDINVEFFSQQRMKRVHPR